MFYKNNDIGYKQALEGIRLKTLVYGKKTLFTEFRLDKGCNFAQTCPSA